MSTMQDTRVDLLTAALSYAAAGVPIVPLHQPAPGGCSCRRADCHRVAKHPRLPNGLTGASTDPATITAWWQHWPDANIGGRTGVVFDVCDVDSLEGIRAVRALLGAGHGAAPLVRTGSGGWHLLYAPTGLGNRVKFLPGTDWRGIGGYVVLPPSMHASGQRYAFARTVTGDLPAVPPALLAALAPDDGAAAPRTLRPTVARVAGYGPAALDRETRALAAMAPGSGRNHALNRAAFNLGQLIAAGHLTEADVVAELTGAAIRAGLGEREVARTIASGLSAGQRSPRIPRKATV